MRTAKGAAMTNFAELRQQVLARAGRAGYGLVRQHRPPYGWELVTVREHRPVTSGTLEELDAWLDLIKPATDASGRRA